MFNVAIALLLVVQVVTLENDQPCLPTLSVDITDGALDSNLTIHKDGTNFDQSNYYKHCGRILGCICKIKKCVRKCCRSNEIFVDDVCQENRSNTSDLTFTFYDKEKLLMSQNSESFNIMYGIFCEDYFILRPDVYPSDIYYLQSNGYLYVPNLGTKQLIYPPEKYCFDHITLNEEDNSTVHLFSVLLCLPPAEKKRVSNNAGNIYYLLVTILSCSFR